MKLIPAQWLVAANGEDVYHDYSDHGPGLTLEVCTSHHPGHAEFIALARNAFDVMMRRNVDVIALVATVFASATISHQERYELVEFVLLLGETDPFTAIVEVDAWIKNRSAARSFWRESPS